MSININNEKEAIQVAFDPKINGEWKGHAGLQMLYLKEYLLRKFNNACTIPDNIVQIQLIIDKVSNAIYLGTIDNNLKQTFPNSIDFFKQLINNCNKRFVIIPILILVSGISGHANMLIVDKVDGTVEHFEPHGKLLGNILGSISSFFNLNGGTNLYGYFKELFNSIGYAYLSPNQTCPLIGPQMIEELVLCHELMIPQIKNKIGMCMIWSLFYAHLRLTYPDAEPVELINNALKNMGTDLCKFIKGYAQTIIEMSKKYNLVVDEKTGIVFDYKSK
jgi:hypothetical protein